MRSRNDGGGVSHATCGLSRGVGELWDAQRAPVHIDHAHVQMRERARRPPTAHDRDEAAATRRRSVTGGAYYSLHVLRREPVRDVATQSVRIRERLARGRGAHQAPVEALARVEEAYAVKCRLTRGSPRDGRRQFTQRWRERKSVAQPLARGRATVRRRRARFRQMNTRSSSGEALP